MTPTPVRADAAALDGLQQALGACAQEAGAACECVHSHLPDAGAPRAQQRVAELLATLDQAFDRLATSLAESARLASDGVDVGSVVGGDVDSVVGSDVDVDVDLTVFEVRDLRESRR